VFQRRPAEAAKDGANGVELRQRLSQHSSLSTVGAGDYRRGSYPFGQQAKQIHCARLGGPPATAAALVGYVCV